MSAPDLSVRIGALRLSNPVLAASGCFGYGAEFAHVVDLRQLGGVVSKGLSLRPRAGNPPPRIAETAAGMLNSIGLENVGVDAFIREKLPALSPYSIAVVANVFGETVAEYAEVCRRLDGAPGVHAVELNLSCPNTARGGLEFGGEATALAEVVGASRRATKLPLWVKLTPNSADPAGLARAAEEAGADAITLINTILGMVIHVDRERPVLPRGTGGLSGPAVRPIAVAQVWAVAQATKLPVVGMGGIACARDAIEFILAGASAVQIGTALFADPGAGGATAKGIAEYLSRKGYRDVGEMVGRALPDGGVARRRALAKLD